jgi:hypothetical protein
MPNQRAAGQTLIAFAVDSAFLAEIDSARGVRSRSEFVRSALYRELVARGTALPRGIQSAPDRVGKGGKKPRLMAAEAEAPYKTGKSKPNKKKP